MATYIVRPYFGHDCDSEQGFNNGYYLPEIRVDALTEEDAIDKAMEQYIAEMEGTRRDVSAWERDGESGDWTLYREFDHVYLDQDGNECDSDAPDAEVYYLYQYIDFSAAELVK